jgi:hypothetical protein
MLITAILPKEDGVSTTRGSNMALYRDAYNHSGLK